MFQLVFKGECTPGTDPETARSNAKTLFKANADQIAKMFSGQPVVIRNKLEEVQAEKYRGVLHKHGMVAYVEPMEGTAPRKPEPAAPRPAASEEPSAQPKPSAQTSPSTEDRPAPPSQPAQSAASEAPTPPASGGVKVEPGDRPNVAGEKVDSILSGSGLTLDPVGITLEEHKEQQAPMFEHLDDWTLAPAGSELGEKRDTPPPVVPDVSHLSLEEQDKQDES